MNKTSKLKLFLSSLTLIATLSISPVTSADSLRHDPAVRDMGNRKSYEPGGSRHLFGSRGSIAKRKGKISTLGTQTQVGPIKIETVRVRGKIGYETHFPGHTWEVHSPFGDSRSSSESDRYGKLNAGGMTAYNLNWSATEVHPANGYDGEQGGGYPAPKGARDIYNYSISGSAARVTLDFGLPPKANTPNDPAANGNPSEPNKSEPETPKKSDVDAVTRGIDAFRAFKAAYDTTQPFSLSSNQLDAVGRNETSIPSILDSMGIGYSAKEGNDWEDNPDVADTVARAKALQERVQKLGHDVSEYYSENVSQAVQNWQRRNQQASDKIYGNNTPDNLNQGGRAARRVNGVSEAALNGIQTAGEIAGIDDAVALGYRQLPSDAQNTIAGWNSDLDQWRKDNPNGSEYVDLALNVADLSGLRAGGRAVDSRLFGSARRNTDTDVGVGNRTGRRDTATPTPNRHNPTPNPTRTGSGYTPQRFGVGNTPAPNRTGGSRIGGLWNAHRNNQNDSVGSAHGITVRNGSVSGSSGQRGGGVARNDAPRYNGNTSNGNQFAADKTNNKTCSFHASTLVKTDKGYTPIADIQIGDKVLAKNEHNGEQSYKAVTAQYSNPYAKTVYVHIQDANSQAQTLIANTIHPFFVNGKWIEAGSLKAGDTLQSENGKQQTVQSVEIKAEPLTAYNLTVADFHTYFVKGQGAETEAVWVHNECDPADRPNAPNKPEREKIIVDFDKSTQKGTPENDLVNNLKPNADYELTNGTKFSTNAHGYVDSISFKPDFDNPAVRNSNQTSAVGKEGLDGDVGGHIQACVFGGTCDRYNLFPQNGKFNNSEYKKYFENVIRKAHKEGKNVENVTVDFYRSNPSSPRPDTLTVTYTIDGEKVRQQFKNEVGGGI